MKLTPLQLKRIGIVGCGAIGSGIAEHLTRQFPDMCEIAAFFDINSAKSLSLATRLDYSSNTVSKSLSDLIQASDLIIEAVNDPDTAPLVRKSLESGKSVLAMSVGKLLAHSDLLDVAARRGCQLRIPSGAIAGVDALKAASLGRIDELELVTRKPPAGLQDNPYLDNLGIDLSNITGETVLFDGNVRDAVKYFPRNINVAATIALATGHPELLRIKILTSPDFQSNSHEIRVIGESGKITCVTENVPSPNNPRTSYLAILSAIESIREFCLHRSVGT